MNIGSLLTRHARYRGHHTALVVGEHRLTYRQLNAQVNALANALLAAGLGNGVPTWPVSRLASGSGFSLIDATSKAGPVSDPSTAPRA
jgi:non-ribosomal peptide synthetase component E (peptide arylation enzyme)